MHFRSVTGAGSRLKGSFPEWLFRLMEASVDSDHVDDIVPARCVRLSKAPTGRP